jgi:hypothetical protein
MQLSNAFHLRSYLLFAFALVEQCGVLLFLAAAGFVLFWKKNRLIFMVLLALFFAQFFFFMVDGIYIGFARWNLFLLPVIIFAAFAFLTAAPNTYRVIAAITVFAVNFLLCPFAFDGTRFSNWATPGLNLGEQIYPYDQALAWLSREGRTRYLIIAGHDYPYYGLDFYLGKYRFYPQVVAREFPRDGFDAAQEITYARSFFQWYSKTKKPQAFTILYHSINEINPAGLAAPYGLKVVKKFSNSQHSLYILRN